MYNNFAKLVKDNLTWWFRNNFAALSAAAIGGKMNMGGDSFNLVAVFIDCNCFITPRTQLDLHGLSRERMNCLFDKMRYSHKF